jgi:hypothetical protein
VPSFHALGSRTEYSRHRVLKKRRSTPRYLDTLTLPMLPPASLSLRYQNGVASEMAPNATKRPLRGTLQQHSETSSRPQATRSCSTPGKPVVRPSHAPPTTTSPPNVRSCAPYRLDTPPSPCRPEGRRGEHTTNSHRPEGLGSRTTSLSPVTPSVHHRNASPLASSPPWQATTR